MMELIEAMEDFRAEKNWSQRKMAHELGISQPAYSEFVNGRRRLPKHSMKKAYDLGVDKKALLIPPWLVEP